MWSFPSSRWGSLKELLRFTCQPHDRPAVGAGFRCAERLAVTTGSRFLRRTECAPTPKRDRKRGGGATRRGYRPAPGETADEGVPRKRGRTARAAARPPGDRAPGGKEGEPGSRRTQWAWSSPRIARTPLDNISTPALTRTRFRSARRSRPRDHCARASDRKPAEFECNTPRKGMRSAYREGFRQRRGRFTRSPPGVHGRVPRQPGERVTFYTAPVTSTFLTPGRFSTWSSSSEATDPPCPEA